MRRKKFHSFGFTLIEAIVALVLIGGAGMALFSWVNGSIVALRRVEDANARNDAVANIVEYMQVVNPMLTPEGKVNFGAYRIEWKSELVTGDVDGISNPGSVGLFRLGLYKTAILVAKTDDPHWFDLTLTQTGFRKVREKQNFFGISP
jgi:general secretion pathway protein I